MDPSKSATSRKWRIGLNERKKGDKISFNIWNVCVKRMRMDDPEWRSIIIRRKKHWETTVRNETRVGSTQRISSQRENPFSSVWPLFMLQRNESSFSSSLLSLSFYHQTILTRLWRCVSRSESKWDDQKGCFSYFRQLWLVLLIIQVWWLVP